MYSIFREDFNKRYIEDFNDYVISVIYGDNILIGKDIENKHNDT